MSGPRDRNLIKSPVGPCLYLYLGDVDPQLQVICGIINRRDFLRIHRGRYREMCKILKGFVENERKGQGVSTYIKIWHVTNRSLVLWIPWNAFLLFRSPRIGTSIENFSLLRDAVSANGF